ncbi:MAG TPA: dihydrodipicolinate synthase family protein [Acidobacteriota bacterium]
MKVSGRVPAIATPLTEDDRIHESELRSLVEFLIGKGVHGFWANGGFSGFAHLRDEDQVRTVRIIVDQASKRVPVLAGITDTSVSRVLERAEMMAQTGADYLFVQPPSYGMWDSSRLLAYYRDVARNVSLPLYIYNDPWSSRTPLDVETVIALGRESNIVGMKESSDNPYQLVALAQHFGNSDFNLLVGTMPLGCYALNVGFDGVVDPTDNFFTEPAVALIEAAQRGDWKEAFAWQSKLDRIGHVLMNLGDYRAAVEACMVMRGLCTRIRPRPFGPLEDSEKLEKLNGLLLEAGLYPSLAKQVSAR